MHKIMKYCSAVREKSVTHNLVNSGNSSMPDHSNEIISPTTIPTMSANVRERGLCSQTENLYHKWQESLSTDHI